MSVFGTIKDIAGQAGQLAVDVGTGKSAGQIHADRYRLEAKFFLDIIPGWFLLPESIQKPVSEGLARGLMARELIFDEEGPLKIRLHNAFEAISKGSMPEPAAGAGSWWNNTANKARRLLAPAP